MNIPMKSPRIGTLRSWFNKRSKSSDVKTWKKNGVAPTHVTPYVNLIFWKKNILLLPSGKLTYSYGKSQSVIAKSSINGLFPYHICNYMLTYIVCVHMCTCRLDQIIIDYLDSGWIGLDYIAIHRYDTLRTDTYSINIFRSQGKPGDIDHFFVGFGRK